MVKQEAKLLDRGHGQRSGHCLTYKSETVRCRPLKEKREKKGSQEGRKTMRKTFLPPPVPPL